MILDQNVEQRFHNINSDPVSTHWNLVSTHTHAMRLTQNETRNINFQFGTTPFILPSHLLRTSSYMNFFRIQCDFILYKKIQTLFFHFFLHFYFISLFLPQFFLLLSFFFRVSGNVISFYINIHTISSLPLF